jgi:hypothetical protein
VRSGHEMSTYYFYAQVGLVRIPQRGVGIRYIELVFLYSDRSAGHIVHSGVFGCETLMHYFLCSGRPGVDPTKTTVGHVMSKLCFCI